MFEKWAAFAAHFFDADFYFFYYNTVSSLYIHYSYEN